MITNYKTDQPFESNFSVEEEEKNSSFALENMEPSGLSTMLKRFCVEARNISGRKTIQSQHYEPFRARQICIWFPFKKAVFHYSG